MMKTPPVHGIGDLVALKQDCLGIIINISGPDTTLPGSGVFYVQWSYRGSSWVEYYYGEEIQNFKQTLERISK